MRAVADIESKDIDVSDLLDGISDGSVTLPDFQRGFEWSSGEIIALVATVIYGWPAGSLLLMKGAPEYFATRPFAGIDQGAARIKYVVLDGQQRLTALHRAFRGSGDAIFALDLTLIEAALESAESLEEAIVAVDREDWPAKVEAAPTRGPLVPLQALTSASDFFQWRDDYVSTVPEGDQAAAADAISQAYRALLGTVNHYQFPSVLLDHELPTEAVARIFERLNRGGLRLSTFDLLVARTYTPEWNLRDEWNNARQEVEWLESYLGDEGLPVAQGLALRERGDIRRPAILRLERPVVHSQWNASVEAMGQAISFAMQSGMRNPDWMPYPTLLIPLASLARDFGLEEHRELLEAWLWARSLGMDYDVASSTKIRADYDELKNLMASGEPHSFELDVSGLLSATRRRSGALWRTFLSLLLRRGALDLLSGDQLVEFPNDATRVSALSLFPSGGGAGDEESHLRVLSFIIMEKGRQRRRDLRQFLGGEQGQAEGANERLASQFLASDAQPVYGEPAALMQARFDAIRAYVDSEFDAIELVEHEPGLG